MQIPYRKPGKFSLIKPDPILTPAKLTELKNKLHKLKERDRPMAAAEVARLAELGDFSENAEYQLAKGKLRGINNAILRTEHQINNAEIIEPSENIDTVQIGHTVTVESGGKQKTYQILGSSETSPQQGIISHLSPVGAALLGRGVGDTVKIKLAGKEVEYKVVKIQSEKFDATIGKEIKDALKDVSQGKNISPGFSSAKKAAKYLNA